MTETTSTPRGLGRRELSVLIPTYNYNCSALVEQLVEQCEQIEGLQFEVLVGDDGSTEEVLSRKFISTPAYANRVRLWKNATNCGRAGIRNRLSSQARYNTLLFLDADVLPANNQFVANYVACTHPVVVGSIDPGPRPKNKKHLLRWKYEAHTAAAHTLEMRRKHPWQWFRTTNFLIDKALALAMPFNEQFKEYGYEDVLFGRQLQQAGIAVKHICNHVKVPEWDETTLFLQKTRASVNTLLKHRNELKGYSMLLHTAQKIFKTPLAPILKPLSAMALPVVSTLLQCPLAGVKTYQLYRLLLVLHKY